jgi:hypothetical protein
VGPVASGRPIGYSPFNFLATGIRTFLKTRYPQLAQVGEGRFMSSAPSTLVPQRTHS